MTNPNVGINITNICNVPKADPIPYSAEAVENLVNLEREHRNGNMDLLKIPMDNTMEFSPNGFALTTETEHGKETIIAKCCMRAVFGTFGRPVFDDECQILATARSVVSPEILKYVSDQLVREENN